MEEATLPCPRCESKNTKFCYFNNNSAKQPRYFCKGCGRHWTEGGTLRDIPVGAGYPKSSKRRKEASSSSSSVKPRDEISPRVEDFRMDRCGGSFMEMLTRGLEGDTYFLESMGISKPQDLLDLDSLNMSANPPPTSPSDDDWAGGSRFP